jgi:hypothetical protein
LLEAFFLAPALTGVQNFASPQLVIRLTYLIPRPWIDAFCCEVATDCFLDSFGVQHLKTHSFNLGLLVSRLAPNPGFWLELLLALNLACKSPFFAGSNVVHVHVLPLARWPAPSDGVPGTRHA